MMTSLPVQVRVFSLSALSVMALVLAGCHSMAPAYQSPALPVPGHWPGDVPAMPTSRSELPFWRDYFTDPVLQRLIATALDNNRDLRIAALRVDEARAAFRIQRADQFPEIVIDGQAARSRTPGDLNYSGRSVVAGENRAEVGLSSWEVDLWGRVRSLKESALQTWLATDSAQQAVRTSLIAEVADGYLGLRELDERVDLARRTVVSRQESYRIFSRRFEVGAVSKLDLAQVQVLLTQAQSLYAQLEQSRASQFHALALLVGGDPGPLPAAAPFDETNTLVALRPGLPSDLLTSRPDIIDAEHRLRAANADIGAARAAFFPRIALTGGWGSASNELSDLFESGSKAWAFVPTLSLPIFDGGRRHASLDQAWVRRDVAVAEYEQAIQDAFREVADALSSQRWLAEQLRVQRITVEAQRERARLAQLRYDNGSSAYLEVLDAMRDLLDAEQQLVQARRSLLSNQVDLYAALGGGRGEPATVSSAAATAPAVSSVSTR